MLPPRPNRKRSQHLTGNDVLNLLGFGQRAGALVLGGEQVRSALKRDDVVLVVLAKDRSKRTDDKVTRLAEALSVPIVTNGLAVEIGRAVGRGEVQVVGIRDRQLAAGIQAGSSGNAR